MDDLFKLAEEICTTEQLKGLLRSYKSDHPDDVRVHAEKKAGVVDHVRRAVSAGAIPIEEVYSLVRDIEENGSQHIFYLRPVNKRVLRHCQDPEYVPESLWAGETDFLPNFQTLENSYVWADYRRIGNHDWLAKIYGHEVRDKYSHFKRDEATKQLTKFYTREEQRVVAIARWNTPDFLELRVPGGPGKAVMERINILWDHLSGAFAPSDFEIVDFSCARKRLIMERQSNRAIYRTNTMWLNDEESYRANFYPPTEEEDVDGSIATKSAVDGYLTGSGGCNELAVTWSQNPDNGLNAPIRIVCGGKNSNEVVFLAKSNAATIDYVTRQLRRFNQ